jgi:hypothetical protein
MILIKGEEKMDKKFSFQILRLGSMLQAANIPFELLPCWDGYQIRYPSVQQSVSDVVCHSGSYGHEQGLLEIMGLVDEEEVGDEVEGWLTAEQVFERWQKHWLENKGA